MAVDDATLGGGMALGAWSLVMQLSVLPSAHGSVARLARSETSLAACCNGGVGVAAPDGLYDEAEDIQCS